MIGIRDRHAKFMNQMDEQAFFSPEEMNRLHCSMSNSNKLGNLEKRKLSVDWE